MSAEYLDYVRAQGSRISEIMEDHDHEATKAVVNAAEWAIIAYDKLTGEDPELPDLVVAQSIAAMVNAVMMWKAFQPPEASSSGDTPTEEAT